jgi:hypothetical protein
MAAGVVLPQCPQCRRESELQPLFSRGSNRLRRRRRQRLANGVDGLSHHGSEAGGKTWIFEQPDGVLQRCRIVRR